MDDHRVYRQRQYRVSGLDQHGDVHSFDTDDEDRAYDWQGRSCADLQQVTLEDTLNPIRIIQAARESLALFRHARYASVSRQGLPTLEAEIQLLRGELVRLRLIEQNEAL